MIDTPLPLYRDTNTQLEGRYDPSFARHYPALELVDETVTVAPVEVEAPEGAGPGDSADIDPELAPAVPARPSKS